jgi:ribosomal protein S18 acetylase RimI-like enzyme
MPGGYHEQPFSSTDLRSEQLLEDEEKELHPALDGMREVLLVSHSCLITLDDPKIGAECNDAATDSQMTHTLRIREKCSFPVGRLLTHQNLRSQMRPLGSFLYLSHFGQRLISRHRRRNIMQSTDAISLRPICEQDELLLRRIFGSTRSEELRHVPWDANGKEAFLRQQFDAQHHYYQEHFGNASYDVIQLGGEPIGRLYVDRREAEIRIIDIALLPDYRGKGIGTMLLSNITEEACQSSRVVRIHVEQNNPALRLYERMGFRKTGETGVYFLMQWDPHPA